MLSKSFTSAIQQIIANAVNAKFNINLPLEQIGVCAPPKKEMGDIATSVSFVLSKELKNSPINIANELCPILRENKNIKSVDVLAGFINLILNDDFLFSLLLNNYDNKNAYTFETKNKLINLEFISANPTGPLHIGHGRWAALGDSVARILERVGYKVQREFYVNDAGVQIQKLKESVEALRNGQPIPEGGYHGEYLKDALETSLDPEVYFLEDHKKTLKRLDVNMDFYFSEKSLGNDTIKDAIKILDEKGFIYKHEGAVWFKTTEFGDDKDRPLIKSDGTYTYFAPDIAYHFTKVKRGADVIIDILGADHHGYIKRISAAVKALSNNKVEFSVLLGQLVNLFKDGVPVRMSKRAGDVVLLDEVIDEVGKDAVRYMLVSKKYNQSINFDIELVKKQTKDNPLFYIQYAFARIHSILKKLPEGFTPLNKWETINLEESERLLIIKSLYYKDEILSSSKEMEPHTLSTYLFDLASLFHKFYEKERVIEENTIIEYRIILINAIARIIKDGLSLLGITAIEKM